MFCTFFTVLCSDWRDYGEKNIAVLASGSGTNAENIIRYFREKGSARVALVLTNRQNAFVLERAKGPGSALCLVCQERLGKWRAYFVDASRV